MLLYHVSRPFKNHFISHFHLSFFFCFFYLVEENMPMPISLHVAYVTLSMHNP